MDAGAAATDRETWVVTDVDGARGVITSLTLPGGVAGETGAAGRGEAIVRLDDGRRVRVPADALIGRGENQYHLPFPLAAAEAVAAAAAGDDVLVVPVVAESLRVERRAVETGRVRIHKTVEERAQEIDEPLLRERVEVERVPVGRVVETAPPVRHEGDTMVVPVLEEVLVVEKRLVLKEELRITRRREEAREPQRVTLRTETVSVERVPPETAPAAADATEHDSDTAVRP
jgi:uncharacterized protein (TIGR02271 family)